jgi:hypothetical protein
LGKFRHSSKLDYKNFLEVIDFIIEQFMWLIPLGFMVGTFGTLIGAGGFILVPVGRNTNFDNGL